MKPSLLEKSFQHPLCWSKLISLPEHRSRLSPLTRKSCLQAADESEGRQWPETFLLSSVRCGRLAGGFLQRETRLVPGHVHGYGSVVSNCWNDSLEGY